MENSFIIICFLKHTELNDYFNYDAASLKDILPYLRTDGTVMIGFEGEGKFYKQICYHGGNDNDTVESITKEIKQHLNPEIELKVFKTLNDYKTEIGEL